MNRVYAGTELMNWQMFRVFSWILSYNNPQSHLKQRNKQNYKTLTNTFDITQFSLKIHHCYNHQITVT